MRDISIHIDVTGRADHDDGVAVSSGFYSEVNQGQFVILGNPELHGNSISLFGHSREQVAEWLECLAQQVRELPDVVYANPDPRVQAEAEKALSADSVSEVYPS